MMVGSDPEGGPRREVGAKEEVVAGGGGTVGQMGDGVCTALEGREG